MDIITTAMFRKVVIIVSAVFSLHVLCLNSAVAAPDEVCLQCLCNVVSNCNLTYGCNDESQCGPFRITEPFWKDAYKPVLTLDDAKNPGAFSRCAVDPTCSAKAVSNYVERYSVDCNQDGLVDCIDFAHLHQNGAGTNCGRNLDKFFLLKLQKCLNR